MLQTPNARLLRWHMLFRGLRRSVHFSKSIVRLPHTLHPGEIRSKSLPSYLYRTGERTEGFESNRSEWCDTAFLCYETLYSLSSKSPQGLVSISTLAWGSQLDISTFRLHYGSTFTPLGSRRAYPVASCLTVEMRQYGDKDSAAEVLSIRNNGHLTESFDTLAEGMNVTGRGNIMAMKCLESGHLVTSSTTVNGGSTLHVWDMRDNLEQAKIPVALINSEPWPKVWFDARGMDVCSVASVDRSAVTDIDTEYRFYSTGISINGFDSTVLVGSSEHAQIAHWDPRSPSLAARTTTACRVKDATSVQRRFFDPVYDIEWNPNNSNEFMSVHSSTIRVWDVRKMDHDAYATFHHMGMPIRKARWSPHHSDCVAGLTMDGVVKIWKVKKFDGPVNVTTPQQHPDELFLHRAQDRTVSDFAWNPYVEDVISTVCPGTEENPGCIQVWRPRNLHDSDENGEP
ncbi:WD40-repeat-containing domain protein [Dissophora ornata]|nr:WD40-repeat-containing domain protein [Dissophora ornata]